MLQAVDLVEQEEGEAEAWELRRLPGPFRTPPARGPGLGRSRDVGPGVRSFVLRGSFRASGAPDKMETRGSNPTVMELYR